MIDPRYDEDNITYGFLKKILGDNVNKLSPSSSTSLSKNYGTTPIPPYSKGDTWNNGDKIYICNSSRSIGSFNKDDWTLLFDKETNEMISNGFLFLSSIELVKNDDGKIETYYQGDDPSVNWSEEDKINHLGDYYQNSSDYKTYIYRDNFEWEEVNVTSIIFDNITGHRNIFTRRPNEYSEGDIWKINNTSDIELYSHVALNDFMQATNSNTLFNENDWSKITNELNIKANLYSPGGKMVSASNIFSNLQYSSFGIHGGYTILGFDEYFTNNGTVKEYSDISLDIDLPDNFKVVSAFLSLFHTPVFWSYFDTNRQQFIDNWGYSRNLKVYKMKSEKNIKLLYSNSVTYRTEINSSDLEEIPNAFRTTSYTPGNTSGVTIERKDTINLKNYLNKTRKTKLVIRTADSVPSDGAIMSQKTGMGRAIVNIIGYIDLKGSDTND